MTQRYSAAALTLGSQAALLFTADWDRLHARGKQGIELCGKFFRTRLS